jgi:hypothetical protein
MSTHWLYSNDVRSLNGFIWWELIEIVHLMCTDWTSSFHGTLDELIARVHLMRIDWVGSFDEIWLSRLIWFQLVEWLHLMWTDWWIIRCERIEEAHLTSANGMSSFDVLWLSGFIEWELMERFHFTWTDWDGSVDANHENSLREFIWCWLQENIHEFNVRSTLLMSRNGKWWHVRSCRSTVHLPGDGPWLIQEPKNPSSYPPMLRHTVQFDRRSIPFLSDRLNAHLFHLVSVRSDVTSTAKASLWFRTRNNTTISQWISKVNWIRFSWLGIAIHLRDDQWFHFEEFDPGTTQMELSPSNERMT